MQLYMWLLRPLFGIINLFQSAQGPISYRYPELKSLYCFTWGWFMVHMVPDLRQLNGLNDVVDFQRMNK